MTSKNFYLIVPDCHLIPCRMKSAWFGACEDPHWVMGALQLNLSRPQLGKKLYRGLSSSVMNSFWICGLCSKFEDALGMTGPIFEALVHRRFKRCINLDATPMFRSNGAG